MSSSLFLLFFVRGRGPQSINRPPPQCPPPTCARSPVRSSGRAAPRALRRPPCAHPTRRGATPTRRKRHCPIHANARGAGGSPHGTPRHTLTIPYPSTHSHNPHPPLSIPPHRPTPTPPCPPTRLPPPCQWGVPLAPLPHRQTPLHHRIGARASLVAAWRVVPPSLLPSEDAFKQMPPRPWQGRRKEEQGGRQGTGCECERERGEGGGGGGSLSSAPPLASSNGPVSTRATSPGNDRARAG